MGKTDEMIERFVEEYSSAEAVRKYTARTAGYGINYLLRNDYAKLYFSVVDSCLGTSPNTPVRLLEFGCGAGMNLIRLLSLLEKSGVPVEYAYGTDFSEPLTRSAEHEAKTFLSANYAGKVHFHVAPNERLAEGLAVAAGKSMDDLLGSFDLILGVNTFRYCHRLGKEQDCAADIYRLLRDGGVCIVIDMNDRFPLFRSRLRGSVQNAAECYLPSLEEYVSPFRTAGFEIIRKDHFCWIPHSAGPALTFCCRLLSPFLNLAARSFAMRSLVVARKPA